MRQECKWETRRPS
jgi:beta-glucosidase